MSDFYPTAEIIADSINECGDRLTTFVLTYHRMIHSEFMTHRMLSKNSSSSRAIPVDKMIAKVIADNVYPLHWGANQKGMVADSEISEMRQEEARSIWDSERNSAIAHARALASIGVHKQVVNRLLEPFSTITVICSGTEYQNFFAQRCHPDAQPEIQALANLMKLEYDASVPRQIKAGERHIPFVKSVYYQGLTEYYDNGITHDELSDHQKSLDKIIKIAVGRCARVSYLNHDGDRNIQDDIKLHDRLLSSKPAHLSPFEHIAIAMPNSDHYANFTGFQSYRYQLENAI
jgi:thymidylate synthase ThyX